MAYELITSVYGADTGGILVGEATLGAANTLWDYSARAADGWNRQQVATIETPELRVVPDGDRGVLRKIRIRTTCDGSVPPGVVAAIRPHDESDWVWVGDKGTVSLSTSGDATGTNTAFTNTVAAGDDTSTVFSLPALATKGRIYRDTTLLVLDTDYTITGTKQITLTTPLLTGETLYEYWSGDPVVIASVGDYFRSAVGFHRITRITKYDAATVDWCHGSSVSATHCVARDITVGESKETVIPCNQTFNTLQVKLVFIPRSTTSDFTYLIPEAIELEWLAGKKRHQNAGV